jgi:hypothetical protein
MKRHKHHMHHQLAGTVELCLRGLCAQNVRIMFFC